MTMRKILAVVLCMCAVLSVMAIVAFAGPAQKDPPAPEPATTEATTKKPLAEQITETWEKIKPYFNLIYQYTFQALSKGLVAGFQWLLSLVGLNFWEGGLFGFLS